MKDKKISSLGHSETNKQRVRDKEINSFKLKFQDSLPGFGCAPYFVLICLSTSLSLTTIFVISLMKQRSIYHFNFPYMLGREGDGGREN